MEKSLKFYQKNAKCIKLISILFKKTNYYQSKTTFFQIEILGFAFLDLGLGSVYYYRVYRGTVQIFVLHASKTDQIILYISTIKLDSCTIDRAKGKVQSTVCSQHCSAPVAWTKVRFPQWGRGESYGTPAYGRTVWKCSEDDFQGFQSSGYKILKCYRCKDLIFF